MNRILLLAFALASPCMGSLANVYIGQASAGGDTGADCANRHANTFFNTAGNWGAGGSQIGADTFVHLCGTTTVTNNTTGLTFQGSGTSGHPITLIFESGAILQSGYFASSAGGTSAGAITMGNGRSYLVVDGNNVGTIQNTANGSALANQQASTGVSGFACTGCVVKNLTIANMYVNVTGSGTLGDNNIVRAVDMNGSNVTVSDNTVHDCGWCLFFSYQNGNTGLQVLRNDISHAGHGIMYAASGAQNSTNTVIDGNKLHDAENWSAGGCPFHQDGIHFFGDTGSSMDGVYVSNNYFYGDWGTCPTGFVFTEAGSSDAHMKNMGFWNNVGILASGAVVNTNGWFNFSSGTTGTQYIVNNTMVGPNATDNTACFVMQNLSGLIFADNLIHSCGSPVRVDSTTVVAINFNFYGTQCQNGGNCFVWNGAFSGSFAGWKAACGCDGSAVQNNTPVLNANGSPQSTSPARGIATNLSSSATGFMSSLQNDTTLGNTRTAIARPGGATLWDAGAYQFTAAVSLNINVITAPVGRTITVDAVGATAPQVYSWTSGTGHTIATSTPQTVGSTRYNFGSWSDGGAISHSVSPSVDTDYTATFSTQYLLTTSASGGTIVPSPASALGDGFYNSGTVVTLTAVPSAGKQFDSWSGDASGSINPTTVTMSAARSVTANFINTTVTVRSSTSVTATQAILKYKVADSSACTIEVSTDPSYSPLVYDVDGALFTGAASDSTRSFVVGAGSVDRQMVIGQRTSAAALDTKFYSRALEANTVHYFRFSCTGGAGIATGSFTTGLAAPPGMGYEHPLFDSAAPWNLAYPTIDYSSTTKTYIDPKTGISMRPLTHPGQVGAFYQTKTWANTDFYLVQSGSWTNPERILNGNASSFAVVSAAGTIFAAIDPVNEFCGTSGYATPCGVEDIGYQMFGGGGGGTASVGVCWSIDSGQTCYSTEYTVSLASGAPVDLGMKWGNTTSPSPGGAGWGKPLERRFLSRWGTGNAVAGALTLTNDYLGVAISALGSSLASYFDAAWPVNSKIWVESSDPTCGHNVCNIATPGNATTLTLTENITNSGKLFKGMQMGFKIRWISGAASITLNHYALAKSVQWSLPSAGGTDQYQNIKITAGDGKQGYLGVNKDTGSTFSAVSFTTTEGEYRILGVLIPPCSIPGLPAADLPACGGGGGPTPEVTIFDRTTPGKMYVAWYSADTGSGLIPSIFSIQYTCTYAAASGYGYYSGTGLTNLNYPSETGCFTWNNITRVTQGRSVGSQVGAVPWYLARWGAPTFFAVVGDYIMYYKAASTQDSITGFFKFDTSGTLVNSFNSWDGSLATNLTTRVSFTGVHNIESIGINNSVALTVDALPGFASGQEYAGPYQTTPTCLYKSGVCAANTSLPPAYDGSYDGTCPANSFGATGNNCIRFRAQDRPCRTSPTVAEKSESPCPWDTNQASMFSQLIVPGDIFFDRGTPTPGSNDTERFMIILKSSLGGGLAEFYAMRDAAFSYCVASNQSSGQKTHVNGWQVAMGIIRNGCDIGVMYIDLAANTIVEGPRADLGGHFDIGFGATSGTYSMLLSGASNGDGIANNQPLSNLSNLIGHMLPYNFNGFGGIDTTLSGITQFYPSIRGAQPNPTGLNWRHLNPSQGARDCPACSVGAVTATLQGGTTSVYKVSVFGAGNYKSLPMWVWAGSYALQDASSPTLGSTITDATPWKYCYAYIAGECRAGSSQGDVYAAIPNADLTGVANVNSFGRRAPSATWLTPVMGWMTQTYLNDKTGGLTRRLSQSWSFPGFPEAFSNARILPDGSGFVWHIQQPGYQRQLFWGKLQNVQAIPSGSTGITFTPMSISIPANASYSQARVRFGYLDFGSASQTFCTPRSEACFVDGSATPFAFAQEAGWATCSSGCTLSIPTVPGKILAYVIERGSGSVKAIQSQVQLVPIQ